MKAGDKFRSKRFEYIVFEEREEGMLLLIRKRTEGRKEESFISIHKGVLFRQVLDGKKIII